MWRFLDNPLLIFIAVALVTAGIFVFTRDSLIACMLLIIPVGLLAAYSGWEAGALSGAIISLLVIPNPKALNPLVSPQLDFRIWMLLTLSYVLFGALVGMRGTQLRQRRQPREEELTLSLEHAQASKERYEELLEEMNANQAILQRMNEELAIINMIATAVNSSLEVAAVLESAMTHIGALLNVDEGHIFWLDQAQGCFVLLASRPAAPAMTSAPCLPLTDGLLGRVMQHQHAERLSEATHDLELRPLPMSGEMKSIIAIPLRIRSRLFGSLVLGRQSGRSFSDDDEKFLNSVGRVLAIGIENAKLFEQTQEMSLVDELTGLSNRRMFNLHLAAEINQAHITGTRLSLVIFDLDFFKRINDDFGHLVGDEILQIFSRVVLEELREHDLFCRFGGEEFALIAPGIAAADAVAVAERIGKRVAGNPFVVEDGTAHPLTVSAGVACLSPDNASADDLIAAADRALYAAKAGGRNRVEVREMSAKTPAPA